MQAVFLCIEDRQKQGFHQKFVRVLTFEMVLGHFQFAVDDGLVTKSKVVLLFE